MMPARPPGWPQDHPAHTDPDLAPWAEGINELCPDSVLLRTLRYVRGRRVAAQVITAAGDEAVIKVYARPRARGNDRRLQLLADSTAAPLLPAPLGADCRGHVLALTYTPGISMPDLDDDGYVSVAGGAGEALRRLHDSQVVLDRVWLMEHEATQLMKTCGPLTTSTASVFLADLDARHWEQPELVCAHRDFHPQQVVSGPTRTASLIDLDDAAQAPRALDTGNFTAHLRYDALQHRRTAGLVSKALAAFRDGYADLPGDHHRWETLALLRLASLAETRHNDSNGCAALLDLAAAVDR